MHDESPRVLELLKEVGGFDAIDLDEDFYVAGIDSMKALDVMVDLESEYDITIPDERFVKVRTARDLVSLVREIRGG